MPGSERKFWEILNQSYGMGRMISSYRHPAYGDIVTYVSNGGLTFAFRDTLLPLSHVDHDRFEAFDERLRWTWSVDFVVGHTNGVTGLHTPLDGGEVVFSRAGFDDARDV